MPEKGLAVIDRTVQDTNRWLKAVMRDTGYDDRQFVFQGMRAVLVTLRDRLPIDLSANLGAQLPLLVRGLYYENYVPADAPHTERRVDHWAEAVAASGENIAPEDAIELSRAVFALLGRELDAGIVEKVTAAMPGDIRARILH